MQRRIGCGALAMLAACFAPAAPAGAPCAAGRVCPDGLRCTATVDGDVCLPAGSGSNPGIDGGIGLCTPKVLLAGGTDVAAQGWQVSATGDATITYAAGVTELHTAASGSGSRQLIALPNAVAVDRFIVEFEVEVVSAGGHTDANASVALMGSFHAPIGSDADRARMIFLDAGAIGFGAGGTSIGFDTSGSHVYHLERTSDGKIVLQASGLKVATGPYDTNGTIAIGDQTSVAGLDSTIRISQIRRLCP